MGICTTSALETFSSNKRRHLYLFLPSMWSAKQTNQSPNLQQQRFKYGLKVKPVREQALVLPWTNHSRHTCFDSFFLSSLELLVGANTLYSSLLFLIPIIFILQHAGTIVIKNPKDQHISLISNTKTKWIAIFLSSIEVEWQKDQVRFST